VLFVGLFHLFIVLFFKIFDQFDVDFFLMEKNQNAFKFCIIVVKVKNKEFFDKFQRQKLNNN